LAGLSFWDYGKIRQGQLTEVALQLPKSLKQRIHATIRGSSRTTKGYIGAAFVAGILISFFELACTGQVYLPTIIFVTGVTEVRLKATAYLLLYNLMFVVPLLAVFLVTYFGTNSKQLTTTFQAHAGMVKLFTAVLFTVLGLWLGYMVLAI
jgi:cytochrome b561